MSMNKANEEDSENEESAGAVLGGLLLTIVVLYFAWRAGPMIDYAANLGQYMDDDDFMSTLIGFLYTWGPIFLLVYSAALIVSNFTVDDDKVGTGSALVALSIGPLGWYIGSEYAEAQSEKAACMAESFLGLSCQLDAPILLLMLFNSFTCFGSFFLVIAILDSWISH